MGRLGLFTPLRFSYWNYRSIEVSKSSFHLWKIFCRADDFSFYDATALEKVTRSYFFLLLLFFRCPINYRGMFSLKTTPIHTCNIKVINWNKTTSWSMKKRVHIRVHMRSTDQTDPSCFYFRISWILMVKCQKMQRLWKLPKRITSLTVLHVVAQTQF